jgi:undecaprenyl-diphosphatase
MAGVGWNWAALLAVITLGVVGGTCREIDSAALDAAQSVRLPALDIFASLVGFFGRAEVTVGIALGLAAARWRSSPREALVPLFIGATILIEAVLKLVVPQAPPPHERSRTIEFLLLPGVHVPFANAFPSGHMARTAFLLRIANNVPTWAVVVGIALMAITRVYLGEHWLSDVVGGLALGLGVANVARRLS